MRERTRRGELELPTLGSQERYRDGRRPDQIGERVDDKLEDLLKADRGVHGSRDAQQRLRRARFMPGTLVEAGVLDRRGRLLTHRLGQPAISLAERLASQAIERHDAADDPTPDRERGPEPGLPTHGFEDA